MLDIFENKILNKYANDYFLMLFNIKDDEIDTSGYRRGFLEIFPLHLINAELKKCKKIYKEIYSWVVDEFLHRDFRPIHEFVLYNMLEIRAELESENDFEKNTDKNVELESIKKDLSDEEIYYLNNINDATFYMDFMFEDEDFLHYKEFYDSFGTVLFDTMEYDMRIIELLPKDKRKELKKKINVYRPIK